MNLGSKNLEELITGEKSASTMIVVNRPSSAISSVFKPTSFINGIAKEENTSSAWEIKKKSTTIPPFNFSKKKNTKSTEVERGKSRSVREKKKSEQYFSQTDFDLQF